MAFIDRVASIAAKLTQCRRKWIRKGKDVKDQKSVAVELKNLWRRIWDQSWYVESKYRKDTRWLKVL